METLETPFILGKSKWERRSSLPEMGEVVHQCRDAGLDIYATETIVHWHIFFKQHNSATFKEFSQKFDEGAQKRDFYKFSKYCIALYRKVHEQQLAGEMNPIERALIEERMAGVVAMDQLGNKYHQDPKDDYWGRRASIVGPDDRELPRAYVNLLSRYDNFEAFIKEEYDKTSGDVLSAVDLSTERKAREIRSILEQ